MHSSQTRNAATEETAASEPFLIDRGARILITGANGFIGCRVVEALLDRGFQNLRCFARPSAGPTACERLAAERGVPIEIFHGNLLSREDCAAAAKDAAVIIHLAAGRGEKSFPDAFLNSVVTTRNLVEGALQNPGLRRFVNISSFAVYSNRNKPHGRWLDEDCPVEERPQERGEAYCFAKVRQDELVAGYGRERGLPYVIVRPGYVIGPGKTAISGRVGIDSFGIFLHLGGSNRIPFTYVDNCADAIVLAALVKGIDRGVFNVVDDDLPTSRSFLRQYKKKVRWFPSLYVPHWLSYLLNDQWQRYSERSHEQLPPVFNRGRWHANWKQTLYSNQALKTRVGWKPRVKMEEALERFFEGCRAGAKHA